MFGGQAILMQVWKPPSNSGSNRHSIQLDGVLFKTIPFANRPWEQRKSQNMSSVCRNWMGGQIPFGFARRLFGEGYADSMCPVLLF